MADEPAMTARLTSEFIGTFFLVLTVFGNVVGGTSAAFAALSIASSLMIMIYALGDVSGAHFNPAVSFAISLSKQQKWDTTAMYCGAQIAGGCFAALVSHAIFGRTFELGPGFGYGLVQAGFAELFYTAMLCFVVLNCACCRANAGNQYFGLAIGYVIVAGGYAVGGVSGACFNPAVSIAIDVSGMHMYWSLIYLVFQLGGAALAYFLYQQCHAEDFGGAATWYAKYLSEFLGVFFLVLTAGCNIVGRSLSAALSIGAALMCMIYALGSLSGAHFNPAVTVAILASGRDKIDVTEAFKYIGAQLAGGLVGALSAAFLMGGTAKVAPAYSWGSVSIAETLFTFVLCYVVLCVATTRSPSKDMFGLAIGSCVIVGGFASGSVGAGYLNPAAAIGLDLASAFSGKSHMLHSLGYTALELAGAGAAAGVFGVTHAQEFSK